MAPQERVFLGKCSTQTPVSATVNLSEGDNGDHAAQSELFSREECYKSSTVVSNLPTELYHLGSCKVQCIFTVTRSWILKIGCSCQVTKLNQVELESRKLCQVSGNSERKPVVCPVTNIHNCLHRLLLQISSFHLPQSYSSS